MPAIAPTCWAKEYQTAGCRTISEGEKYATEKRKRESESNLRKAKESVQLLSSGKVLQRAGRPINKDKEPDGIPGSMMDNHKIKTESGGKDSSSTVTAQGITKSLDQWDIRGLPGANLLSTVVRKIGLLIFN